MSEKKIQNIKKMTNEDLVIFIEENAKEFEAQTQDINPNQGANWAPLLGLSIKYKSKIDLALQELGNRERLKAEEVTNKNSTFIKKQH